MAVEFAQLGVRVNAVAPGEIETAMLSPETEVLIPRIPLHRLGTPEDVASTILIGLLGTQEWGAGGRKDACAKCDV